jgi:hypothetical protein
MDHVRILSDLDAGFPRPGVVPPLGAAISTVEIVKIVLAGLAIVVAVVSGCAPGAGSPTPSTTTRTVVSTRPPPSSSPIASGPTTAATAATCPFLAQQPAADTVGMRLARITVLRSGGKTVGCRFYALQGGPLHQSEHLPGPNQPAVEIVSSRYPSATAAHNAFVVLAQNGTNLQQASIVGQTMGLCFQTDFYPQDKGTDWACTFSKDTTMVLVKTVVTTSLNAILLARAIARHF